MAIDASKHIYAEKPVAVDVPGVLSVLESARLAKLKNLVILDGFCWRYDKANEEAHRKLSSGQLGRVLSFDGYIIPLLPSLRWPWIPDLPPIRTWHGRYATGPHGTG